MAVTRCVTWVYDCDATTADGRPGCGRELEVSRGDECDTGRGTVVYDQADAHAVARQAGWTLGRVVLCPTHAGGGR